MDSFFPAESVACQASHSIRLVSDKRNESVTQLITIDWLRFLRYSRRAGIRRSRRKKQEIARTRWNLLGQWDHVFGRNQRDQPLGRHVETLKRTRCDFLTAECRNISSTTGRNRPMDGLRSINVNCVHHGQLRPLNCSGVTSRFRRKENRWPLRRC